MVFSISSMLCSMSTLSVAFLIHSMREGNQEGACRISSSLEEILERVGVESSDDTSSEQTESSKCTSFASPGSGMCRERTMMYVHACGG